MAKEILNSRKAVTRIYTNKAHLMTLGTTLTEQMGEQAQRGAAQHSTAQRSAGVWLRRNPAASAAKKAPAVHVRWGAAGVSLERRMMTAHGMDGVEAGPVGPSGLSSCWPGGARSCSALRTARRACAPLAT